MAQRRLERQDQQLSEISEHLLDHLQLRPNDRVVELGTGSGNFARRIVRRLGEAGVLRGVDFTQRMLDQARRNLDGAGGPQFELILDDIQSLGTWLDLADVVTGRTILHHIPMVETFLGKLRARVRPGTRVGFVEPEFRLPAARIALLEEQGRSELAPLRLWAEGIVRYYQASGLSPEIGATLPQTLDVAGYRDIKFGYYDFPVDHRICENALLYYQEIGARYIELNIMSPEEIEQQERYFSREPDQDLPTMWGMHYVSGVT